MAGASEAALQALTKLDQVLPPRLRSRVRGIHDSISTLPGAQVRVDSDVLVALAAACRDRVRVEFGYDDRDGATPSSRRVEPYGVVATGRRWYLMAYDLERDDWRTFRLDRINGVRSHDLAVRLHREHDEPARVRAPSGHLLALPLSSPRADPCPRRCGAPIRPGCGGADRSRDRVHVHAARRGRRPGVDRPLHRSDRSTPSKFSSRPNWSRDVRRSATASWTRLAESGQRTLNDWPARCDPPPACRARRRSRRHRTPRWP